jgi:hypothetical protein
MSMQIEAPFERLAVNVTRHRIGQANAEHAQLKTQQQEHLDEYPLELLDDVRCIVEDGEV